MGTNNIKPFATSGSANVMTDVELSSAEELSTGFKLRSRADSRLIGKLIQNASAAAYAVGKFTADNSDGTITGTDAEGFATNFDAAIKKVVTETAGEAGDYVTSEQLTSALEPKADKTQLANYAPLAGAAFTGPVTVQTPTENGHPATKQYVDEAIPDTSNLATKDELSQKADSSTLANYAQLSGAAFTGTVTVGGQNVATVDQLPTDVLTKAEASTTYATQTTVTQGLAGKADTVHTHTIENVTGLQDALDGKQATGDYAVKSDLDDYLPLAGGTIDGDLTVTGTINASIEGTTENAVKLATARNITLTGAVTGASTTGFDGSADVAINTTAVNGTMVTGVVPEATKATQDGDGNVISTTYAKVSQLTSVMTYKGTVGTVGELPQSDQSIGDVYNVTDTNMNYAWDGSQWDQLGSSVDLSGYLTTENANTTFATKSELTSGYLPVAGGTVTGTITATGFTGPLTGTASQATADGAGNPIVDTYATKSELSSGLAGKSNTNHTHTAAQVTDLSTTLASYAPLASPALTGTPTVNGQNVATADQLTPLATKSELGNYIPKAGDIEPTTVNQTNHDLSGASYTITKDSPDVLYLELTGDFAFTCQGGDDANRTIKIHAHKAASVASTATITWNGVNEWLTDGGVPPTFGQVPSVDHNLIVIVMISNGVVLANTLHNSESGVKGGSITIDQVTGLQGQLDGKAPSSHTHTVANITDLTSTLAAYAPLANPAFTGTATLGGQTIATVNQIPSLDGYLTSSTAASTYQPIGDYATNTALAAKADASALANYVPVAGGTITGALTVNGGITGNLNGNATTATSATDATKIALTGDRGQLAGWETVATGTTTIDQNSPDSMESDQAITVSDGTSGTCWTKVAHLTSASPSVSLGTNWRWQGGSTPELKQDGFLVLCWCSSRGLAIYNNVG